LTGLDKLKDVVASFDNLSIQDPETRRVARLIGEGFDALSEALKDIGDQVDAIKEHGDAALRRTIAEALGWPKAGDRR
jgi:hypothetical protein